VAIELPQSTIYLFKDLGPHAKDAQIHRLLRDAAALGERRQSTVILVDSLSLPPEVKRLTVPFEIGWPTAEELEDVIKQTYAKVRRESMYEVTANLTRRDMDQLVQTLRGLTRSEAERIVASAIYKDYTLKSDDLPMILEAKRALLGAAGCLESVAVDFVMEDVGGLDNLKAWLRQRRDGFSKQARDFGLPTPRGILMLGIPGAGKSLCAKAVAADWRMPLLRLDPGVLYQKYIGESESLLRQALAQAEAMAPVILWIDEIEKAFASASAASADGGLSKRMFGTLLSWMQDHRHPIFIVATANDVSALPPELMRKGRFDEVFFVDLPSAEARASILAIHLERRNRVPGAFDIEQLAAASEGFNGSELEQSVIGAMYAAFQEKVELQSRHIFDDFNRTKPLSTLMHEKIMELREWAANRCVSAD
jgi:SpoVK/Ycf46/Vps4 family AAA+-type ATPase